MYSAQAVTSYNTLLIAYAIALLHIKHNVKYVLKTNI